MGVASDVQSLDPISKVEMFVWDATALGDPNIIRWHPGTTVEGASIVWQGEVYQPLPIESSGFDRRSNGSLPRPTLSASNIGGAMGAYLRSIAGGLGAKVTRKRTLGKYLDAVNFPLNGNPHADPTASFPDEVFFVARKSGENAIAIEVELAVRFDLNGIKVPRRQVIAGTCQWIYRSPECSYAGPPVEDINGNPTSDPAQDMCRKTLQACKARFGANGVLRTSAFPASLLGRTR